MLVLDHFMLPTIRTITTTIYTASKYISNYSVSSFIVFLNFCFGLYAYVYDLQ